MSSLEQPLDLCIIGGGINGAGVALDAARRGLRVGLYEQYDFGCGASTATSKLAHGGLRYLEQRQFKLVKESLGERNFLLNAAPHLVKPLQFYVPIYKESKWRVWALKLGLSLYDWMQKKSPLPGHRMLDQRQVKQDVPWLKMSNFMGCGSYFDAQMDDHRLVIELLMMARQEGALIQNYTKVTGVHPMGSGVGIDLLSNHNEVSSRHATSVIMATGAWNNQFSSQPIVKPTKGVHIVLPDMDLSVALLLMHPKDDRVFFIMPWQGKTLVGTTDQPDDSNYNKPSVTNDEAQYLLDAVNNFHTQRTWGLDDIQAVFVGYRPLISTDENQPSSQTREESYAWIDHHVLAMSGGKYTTYRLMAERALNMVQKKIFSDRILAKSTTKTCDYIGRMSGQDWPSETQLKQLSQRYQIQQESILHLMDTYGMIYKDILNVISYQKEYAIRFDIGLPMVVAELKYAIAREWVKTLDDFMFRRTYYGYLYYNQPDVLRSMASHFKQFMDTSLSEDEMVSNLRRKMTLNG